MSSSGAHVEVLQPASMSPDSAIHLSGLGKCYQMFRKPSERLWQAFFGGKRNADVFWALRGIDLDIKRGETFGIIGRNGSGKSTLLQMIAGTLTPTEGALTVKGRVAALLELGSGFNLDFTGRENVYLNATILGLTRREIDTRLESILAFAEIGEFIDQPVRSYSSGMVVRLAFSVIVHVDADVLIVDEALSVGDAFFSQKCMRFLRDFQKRGTLLFVSHDAAAVTNLCDRVLWLEHGAARMLGSAKHVVELYMAQQHVQGRSQLAGDNVVIQEAAQSGDEAYGAEDVRRNAFEEAGVVNRMQLFEFNPGETGVQFGAGAVEIKGVSLEAVDREAPVAMVVGGEIVKLSISFLLLAELQSLIAGFYVKDRLGQRLFGDNTHFTYREEHVSGVAGEVFVAEFVFRMPILPSGSYMIDVAVASGTQDDHTQQHWIHDAMEFRAIDETMKHGLIGIPMHSIAMRRGTSP